MPTLLCVDDEPGILATYGHYLDGSNEPQPIRSARSARREVEAKPSEFRVLLAESGTEAVQVFADEMAAGRRIQVAFLDMDLRGDMDGIAVMRALRSIDPQLLCVFATASRGYSLEDISRHFPSDSLDEWDYLSKPFSANEIVQKARNMAASWFRRRNEESLRRLLDETNLGLEAKVSHRTRQLAQANRELRRKGQELEQVIRSKDEFLATVSHELRTPLTAVVGLAEELRAGREMFTGEEVDEFIAMIAEQSRDVAHIIEDLLVSARVDVGTLSIHPRPVDLGPEIDAVLRSGSLHHQTRRRLSRTPTTATAWADPTRVRQIIRNLVVNALRYGGESIDVDLVSHAGIVRLVVSDSGPELSAEQAERIFEPYYTAHDVPTQPGSVGLGLALSRRLARMMSGDLTYHHADGWSRFELSLPAGSGV